MGGNHAMKTRHLFFINRRSLKKHALFTTISLIVVTGMLLASVLLPPLTAPVHALNAPSQPEMQIPNSNGVSGTLASFTALIPEIVTVSLPLMLR
jgi:hypothetical protein